MHVRSFIIPLLVLCTSAALVASGGGGGGGGGGSSGSGGGRDFDRGDRISNQQRDLDRAREREVREAAKSAEREAKARQESVDRQAKEAADLEARAIKDAEDAAEREAKAIEDAAERAIKEAEDAAKDAEDAAREDHSGSGHDGASSDDGDFRTLAAREKPEFDALGFPTRRGEVISLNIKADALARARQLGFSVIERTRLKALEMDLVRLRAPAGMTASEALRTLEPENAGNVDFDHFYAAGGTADAQMSSAPGSVRLKPVVEKTLWVGMIDTGVAANRAIKGLSIEAQNFSQGPQPVAHGTAVASLLRRAGAAKVTSANVFSADARPYAPAERIVRALDWMVARRVPVINISIAGPHNIVLDRAISAATSRGHLVVAAAGNGGPAAPPAFPAASPGAIAVTAVDAKAQVYLRANHGGYITIAAPGVGLAAATPDGSMKLFSGTSFASPLAAAWLARCMGPKPGRRSEPCIQKMETSAVDLGAPGRDTVYGFGLIMP